MRRWEHVLLFVFPLLALAAVMWMMHEATTALTLPLEGPTP